MNHFVLKDMTPKKPGPGVEMRVIHGEQMTMVSMRSKEIIIRAEARNGRHAGGLLADVKVIVAAEHALIVQRHQAFFEVPDEKHPAAQLQQIIARQFRQHDACDLIKRKGFVNDRRWN